MTKANSKKSIKMARKKRQNPTAIGQAIRALGGLGGGVLGGYLGNASLGKAAGTGLGAMVSKWLGQGDYVVTSNSLVNRFRTSGDIPNMHRNGQSVVVRHREYITDVTSAENFTVDLTVPLNPGLASSFPWLSTIAQQYQEYTWKGVIFEYVSTSGDVVASSNTALGTVMMSTQYRSTNPTFTSKQQMLNEYFATDGKPSECFCHPIECNPRENPYNVQYVRTGPVPPGEDAKSYDLGIMYLAAQGMQAGSVDVGELWVTYEVELRKPILSGALDNAGEFAIYSNTTGVAAATPFGTQPGTSQFFASSIALTFSATTINFPAQCGPDILLIITFGNTITVATNNTWLSGGALVNCTASMHAVNNGSELSGATANGTNACIFMTYITITNMALPASFTPAYGTLTGAANVLVRAIQVPTNAILF